MQPPISLGFPLSPQQKHLWTLERDGSAAVGRIALLLEGPLVPERLKAALAKVIHRHEILRTTFQRSPGMKLPFQVVHDSAPPAWEELDLQNAAGPTRGIDDLLDQTPQLSPERLPVVHASLARLSPDRHAWVVTVLDLCADNLTLDNLVSECCALYSDPHASLPDAVQYAEYAEWQNELLQRRDEETTPAIQHWESASSQNPPELPFFRKADPDTVFLPQAESVLLDSETRKRLSALGFEPADLLLAAWQLLLARTCRRPEFTVAWASSGRSQEELRAAMGPFAKALPLRADFAEDLTFSVALQKVVDGRQRAEEFQDLFPFPASQAAWPAAFLADEPWPARTCGGVSFSLYRRRLHASRFGVGLQAGPQPFDAQLLYDPACCSAATAERLSRNLAALLAAIAVKPDSPVWTLPILDADERRQVVETFNRSATAYPHDKCLHELFEAQTARAPERPALRFGEAELSYGELNARANRLAHHLRKRGVGPGVPVGLCMDRSADMIAGILGILKAGGCYVPLLPGDPKVRVARQLSEAGARLVCTQRKALEALREFEGETIILDEGLEDEPATNPAPAATPENLVYILYTSGSTGTPKGVAVRHRNLVSYTQAIASRLGLDDHSQGLHFATVSTLAADLGNTCIFPSLAWGGCLHVIDYETAMDASAFARYLAAHPIDVLKITPSQMSALLSGGNQPVLPAKYLLLGGEKLSWELVAQIRARGACRVLNHYGPTETTVGCCTFAPDENDVSEWRPGSVPIGRPLANYEMYILDRALEPVPIGVPGELCIGGAGVAAGYINQAQQTAERFVAHPFSNDPSARLYRTGDLARFLPDGNVEFLGRIDHQVKIRGYRVEPGEIEAALRQHAAIRQAAVAPEEDGSGSKILAAYFVAAKRAGTNEVRAFLRERLPEYMVPARLLRVEEFPLTPNGKIDWRALAALAGEPGPSPRETIQPRTPDEEKMLAIWKDVLKTDSIGVSDNFFDVGGHSLLATQMIARIRNVFGVQMPLHRFLESPTVADLAAGIPDCPPLEQDEADMSRLLEELEGLSDEEAERLLAAEIQKEESAGA